MKKRTFITASYWEIEELIKKYFDVPEYEFLSDIEANNDTYKVFYVRGKEFAIDRWQKDDWEKWLETKGRTRHHITHNALNKLAADEVIEDGDYLVEVSW